MCQASSSKGAAFSLARWRPNSALRRDDAYGGHGQPYLLITREVQPGREIFTDYGPCFPYAVEIRKYIGPLRAPSAPDIHVWHSPPSRQRVKRYVPTPTTFHFIDVHALRAPSGPVIWRSPPRPWMQRAAARNGRTLYNCIAVPVATIHGRYYGTKILHVVLLTVLPRACMVQELFRTGRNV